MVVIVLGVPAERGPRSGGEVCFSSTNNRRWLMASTPYFANFLLQTGWDSKKIEENFEKI